MLKGPQEAEPDTFSRTSFLLIFILVQKFISYINHFKFIGIPNSVILSFDKPIEHFS